MGVVARAHDLLVNTDMGDMKQPEWMVRELWGPGKMPKGMMVRLLRHTIFTNYGVPKEYEGAKSTAEGPQALAERQRGSA